MYMSNDLGKRISDLLKQNGLSQKELAEKIGVTNASMSRYINGERIPKGPVVASIAGVLHVEAEYLLGMATSEEDPELEFYKTQRAIARNAKNWTPKQKADLVNAIIGAES
jgi:transcriptional regulator with XRE-family HTH domain